MRLPLDLEREITAGEPRYRDHELTHEWELVPIQGYRRRSAAAIRAGAPQRRQVVRIDRRRRRIEQ